MIHQEITLLQSQPLQKKRILKFAVMLLLSLVLGTSVTLNFLYVTGLIIHFPLLYLPPVAKTSFHLPFLFSFNVSHSASSQSSNEMTFCFLAWK